MAVAKKKQNSKNASRVPQTMEELLTLSKQQLKGFKQGDFVEGTIVEIRPKTVFIDIGGKTEGIVTGKELQLVKDFVSQFKIGDKITAQIRVLENDRGQTLLSLRKSSFNYSWQFFEDALKSSKVVEVFGKEINRGGVVTIAHFGLFGFIPGSQIGKKYNRRPESLIGQKINVQVLEVDREKNRLVFSERTVSEPKLVEKEKKTIGELKEGDKFNAEIIRVEPFGLFITMPLGKSGVCVEGLVHISEISWEKVTELAKMFKIGEKIKVMLLNKADDKLQFSVKRLTFDPWEEIEKKYPPESPVKGKVVNLADFGALINLEPGIEGLIHVSKIPPTLKLKMGAEVKCFIEHVDKDRRRLSLVLAPTGKPIGYK